jgi:hypothetical protein
MFLELIYMKDVVEECAFRELEFASRVTYSFQYTKRAVVFR